MINSVILTGRCVETPELKKTTQGTSVTSFAIANETGYGEHKKTNFISIVAWGKTAEFVCNYFKKGDAIGINGRIDVRKYQDKNGNNRTVTEVIAAEIHFLESKKDTAGQQVQNAELNAPYNEPSMSQNDDDFPW